ncbi:ABC transporter permease [Anaerobacillus alkaliphilus]|uniref:Transport permease protein n=1 Tax=Anaerobacillus alkaliphilus TaxID=1548597 RepID=A0A4Q0VUN7_9BACI|nr:ABC transporter permease [Anaerobacillus alkaliphilus]RXJ01675.1 ABC transporter permease [Anaerobacillus alkaliphilus]
MRYVFKILHEQMANFHLIKRLTIFELRSMYQMHYLGILWQFINPLSQVMVFWFVFGIGIRGGQPIGDVPFFVWLIAGLIPWFFISPVIIQGSNSIYTKLNFVSKMKFPLSVIPTITILRHSIHFLIMFLFLGLILVLNEIYSGMYLLQLPYYIAATLIFLFSVTLFCSTISIIVRDFQLAIQAIMRMLFFVTPIMWDASGLSERMQALLKLNPLSYIIDGFRYTLLGQRWFFDDLVYTGYFWSITLLFLFVGAIFHIRFRHRFVDYL